MEYRKRYGKTEGTSRERARPPEALFPRPAMQFPGPGEDTVKLASVPMSEMQRCFLSDGAPRKVEVIELVHYG